MSLRTVTVITVFLLAPGFLSAQEVNTRVGAIDPAVHSRVQDPDQPDSPLLPGGSSAWTGQPIMSQTPSSAVSGAAQKPGSMSKSSEFPGLVGVSVWGPSAVAPTPSADASSAQEQAPNAKHMTKATVSRKLNVMAAIEAQSVKSGGLTDEFLVEQNLLSSSNPNLRKLKRATGKSARLRITRPFQGKADAATASLWGADNSSSYALGQQENESGMLLHYGFNARSNRRAERKRHHHHKGSSPTSH